MAPPSRAHDFWIEAAGAGPATVLHLCVGERLAGDERALRADRALRAEWRTAVGVLDLRPPHGAERLPPSLPGGAAKGVFVYASAPSAVSLPAARFEAYLHEEGLDHVLVLRRAAGQTALPGHERYTRAAKALVGPPEPALATAAAGLRLEIVPEQDPRAVAADGVLPVRVRWERRPLANVLVQLLRRAPDALAGELVEEQRTAADGRAVFRLRGPGTYLLKALHMVPVEDDPVADWESVWSSLTFER